MSDAREPRILVFACNWCAYTAADLAGTARLAMPASFTVVRVMCSGRVDPIDILRALLLGADGVIVAGCHPGDCHYTSGNLHAKKRVDFLAAVLDRLGLAGRVEMQHISASEGARFQEVISDFAAGLGDLGSSPLSPDSAAVPTDRRTAFRALLARIVANLRAELPPESALPAELVADGYGEPVYDPEKCVGCGACFASCPAQNIELADADGERSIAHFHSRCVRCSVCQDVCPTGAITVSPRFDIAAFLDERRTEAVRLALGSCRTCGQPIAPVRHIEYLAESLREQGPELDDVAHCETCRRTAHAAEMRRHIAALSRTTPPAEAR